jgi:hypothetical protein
MVKSMLTLARRLGAVAILATGAVHLQQYLVQDFRGIPTIQVLFLLNVIGSGVVGFSLLAPLDRVLPSRWANTAVALLAVVGLTIAVGSLVGLFISENGTLFGLRSRHYSTAAVLAIVAEGVAVLLLTPLLANTGVRIFDRGHIAHTESTKRPPRWSDRTAAR